MYTLQKTTALSSKVGATWETIDAGPMLVRDLFLNYRRVIMTLKTDDDSIQYVELEQLKPSFALFNNTLSLLLELLSTYGFVTIPEDKLPGSDVKYARYTHGIRAGYHIRMDNAKKSIPDNATDDLRPDLRIWRDYGADPSLIDTKGLVSVNGFLHDTYCENDRCYVIDGGKSVRVAQDNQFGYLSFFELGGVKKVHLEESQISIPQGYTSLKDSVQITLREDQVGKSGFLVLGGYMVLPREELFWKVSERIWHLDLKKLEYLSRLLTSHLFIDMSPLKLNYLDTAPDAFSVDEAWSDAVIKRYLMLSQTFMVFVDKDVMTYDRHYLQQVKVPGSFVSYSDPAYPMFVADGRMTDYWKVQESGRWSVTVADSYHRLYAFYRENEKMLKTISSQLAHDRPFRFSDGVLLEIGGYNY